MPRRSPLDAAQAAPQAELAQAVRRAVAMQRGGWLAEAEKIYSDILKVAPGHFDALCLLGQLYQRYGRSADALRVIDRALAIAPNHPALVRARTDALANLGPTLPSLAQPHLAQPHLTQPPWQGDADLAGKTILLQTGEDLCETLRLIRHAGLLAQKGARVVLEVARPLRRLVASSFPDMNVLARGDDLPAFDLCVPLSGLPQLCSTASDASPWPGPYLEPSVELIAAWARELPSPKKLRIGLGWSNPALQGRESSCALPSMERLLSLPRIAFVNLQPELRNGDASVISQHYNIARLQRSFSDFADVAAVVVQLDGVVACDEPLAHVAAAMGKPVLLLLPYGSKADWLAEGRADRPWYPTVRFYHQHKPGDWSVAIGAVREELIYRAS